MASPGPGHRPARVLCLLIQLLTLLAGALLVDGDGCGVLGTGPEGALVRVVGERDAAGPHMGNHLGLSGNWAVRVVLFLPVAGRDRAAQDDSQGGEAGQNLGFADVGVLRPGGAWAGDAGVAVAAPVGRFAVGPARLQEPSADPAAQQPGEPVAASRGTLRAAPGAQVLGRDVVGLADDRRMRGRVEMTQPSGRFHRATAR